MERKTAADFDPELLVLFDAYVHGHVDRRGFLDRAGKFAAGSVTAAVLLDMLSPKFAEAQQIAVHRSFGDNPFDRCGRAAGQGNDAPHLARGQLAVLPQQRPGPRLCFIAGSAIHQRRPAKDDGAH